MLKKLRGPLPLREAIAPADAHPGADTTDLPAGVSRQS
jgi:hypothetical protein